MMMMTPVTEQKRQNELAGSGGGGHGSCSESGKRPKCCRGGSGGGNGGGGSNPTKEKKDKVGERVAALQQMVCPFGKTDTASVLQEATEYIKFLQDQLQVLSTPYLRNSPTGNGMLQEAEYHSLRSRGLCLMPTACTRRLAHSNGADIWAPNNTSNPPKS